MNGRWKMDEDTYHRYLDRAFSQLPPDVTKKNRFEIPNLSSVIMGNRTIIHNLKEISDIFRRKPGHLLKYLSKELATSSNFDGTQTIFQGKFNNSTISRLIARYAKEFVYCPICKKPDTKIVKERRYNFIICEACGAKSSVKSRI